MSSGSVDSTTAALCDQPQNPRPYERQQWVGSGTRHDAIPRMHHCECAPLASPKRGQHRKGAGAAATRAGGRIGVYLIRACRGRPATAAQRLSWLSVLLATKHETPSIQSAAVPEVLGLPEVGVETGAKAPGSTAFP